MTSPDPLPTDLAAAHAMILAEQAARVAAELQAQDAEAEISGARREIERLKLLLEGTTRAVRPAPCTRSDPRGGWAHARRKFY